MRGAVLRREAALSRSVGPVPRRAWRCPRAPPTPQGLLLRQLPLPGFLYVRPRLQPYEVIPEDLSLPNSGADASPSLLWCRTPAFQDPFPTGGNEGFSSPFSLGLACCRCVSSVERASNRRGVLLAISG